MKKICLFLVCILFQFSLQAQDLSSYSYEKLDSLVEEAFYAADETNLLRYLEASLACAKRLKKDSAISATLSNLGYYYTESNDYERAIEQFKAAKVLFDANSGKWATSQGYFLTNFGYLKELQGDYAAAETHYLAALQLWEASPEVARTDYAITLNTLAVLYSYMGNYEAAEPLYLEVIDIWKKELGTEVPEYTIGLNNLAVFYHDIGNYEAAESLYLELLGIEKKILGEEDLDYSNSLNNLANLYQSMGRYTEAEPIYLQSIAIRVKKLGKKHKDYAESLNNLAVLYEDMGQAEKAKALYQEAIGVEVNRPGREEVKFAIYLHNLGVLYADKDQAYDTALDYLLRAAQIRKKYLGQVNPDYAGALNSLGRLYWMKEAPNIAFSYTMASLRANSLNFDALFPNSSTVSLDTFTHTPAYHLSTDVQFNLNTIQKLLKLDYVNSVNAYKALVTLLGICQQQSQKTGNLKALEQEYQMAQVALQINERFRRNFVANQSKLRLIRQNETFIKTAMRVVRQLARKSGKATPYYKAAFSFAEQNKSLLLADALKNDRAHSMGDLPDSLVQLERSLKEQRTSLQKQRLSTKDPEVLAGILAQENELNTAIDEFLRSVKGKYPQYHAFKYENITATAEHIQGLLEEDQLLLEYLVMDSMTYLFSLSPTSIQLDTIPIRRVLLNKKVGLLREALSNYKFILQEEGKAYSQYTQTAYWFYEQLLAPALERHTNVKKLVIIADGGLGFLPFEAFLKRAAQQGEDYSDLDYLLKDYQISYNYSATLFQELQSLSNTKQHNGALLALAPTYNPAAKETWAHRPLYLRKARQQLIALPQALEEVKTISSWWPKSTVWVDSNANEAKFKAKVGEYAVLHLAMHGWLNTRAPILSSLVFSENGSLEQDNFLQADEISKLQLNAELVVLSACETGYGKFERGEGVLSLARSFMYAGVPSLVVSLWQVNDGSTAIIMKNFYQYLAKGMNKAEALQRAKLDYLNQATEIVAHPAFWSPFIQLGDSQALQTTTSWQYWAIGVGFLLILILLGRRLFTPKEA